jgi:hypothetical protein
LLPTALSIVFGAMVYLGFSLGEAQAQTSPMTAIPGDSPVIKILASIAAAVMMGWATYVTRSAVKLPVVAKDLANHLTWAGDMKGLMDARLNTAVETLHEKIGDAKDSIHRELDLKEARDAERWDGQREANKDMKETLRDIKEAVCR